MARLQQLFANRVKNARRLNEADDEAPLEGGGELSLDDDSTGGFDVPDSTSKTDEAPVEGTEEEAEESEEDSDTEEDSDSEEKPAEVDNVVPPPEEDDDNDLGKNIEGMVGVTEIQHTSSSTIIDFEDGGQLMFVQPFVMVDNETLNCMIDLIIGAVTKTYETQKDEITGKKLVQTKYWQSIEALVSTMVRSQLTKSDNFDGLMDEIKQIFKVLEVK